MEQMNKGPDLVTASVIAENKRKARFDRALKLRAFNIFAFKIRPSIRDEFEGYSGLEIKRIVGQKWANTTEQEKSKYFDEAQREHDDMVAKGLRDPNTPENIPSNSKSDMEAEAIPSEQPVKRKRGRPRKSETSATQGGEGGGVDGLTPNKSDAKPKRERKKKIEAEAAPATVDVSLIGQQVSGVLDGSFDAGYLLTVRVGNSHTVLRGAVFGPGLAVPVSKINDVAPTVRQVKIDDRIPLPPPAPMVSVVSPTVVSASMAVGSVATPGIVIGPTSLPAPVVSMPTGSQALPAAFGQPEMPHAGYIPVPYSSAHTSYTVETMHRRVDVQSGA